MSAAGLEPAALITSRASPILLDAAMREDPHNMITEEVQSGLHFGQTEAN